MLSLAPKLCKNTKCGVYYVRQFSAGREGLKKSTNLTVSLNEGGAGSGVAVIRLNRADNLNALSTEMCSDVFTALRYLQSVTPDQEDSARCVILTGDQKTFAAGADIREMAKFQTFAAVNQANILHEWTRFQQEIRIPTIAAVHGYALGGGCELAMMCDIILAAETAVFGQPELRLGLIPGMGATQRLVRSVGKSKAMEWILTGRTFTAQEACQAGLVSKVVPADYLMDCALTMAEKIASHSAPAVRTAKECVNKAFEMSQRDGLDFELRAFHSLFSLEDCKEGTSAFLEKRTPCWKHQ